MSILAPAEQRVFDRVTRGMPPREIAADIGVSITKVYEAMRRLRDKGVLDRPPRNVLHQRINAHTIRWGSVARVMQTASPELQAWVSQNTPDGATVAGLVLAVFTDAMNEESLK